MSRFRSRRLFDSTVPVEVKFRQKRWTPNDWSHWFPFGEPSAWKEYGFQTMTDEKTVGYFRAKREGKTIPVSPMSKEYVQHNVNSNACGMVATSPTLGWIEVSSTGLVVPPGFRVPAPLEAPSLDAAAAMQAALARAQRSGWDALTFIAEFRKTLTTLVGFRKRAESFYKRFAGIVDSRSRGFSVAERAKVISEVWLELRYAWRPLLYDIRGINNAIVKLSQQVEEPVVRAYETVRADAQDYDTVWKLGFETPAVSGSISNLGVIQTTSRLVTSSGHASVGVRAQLSQAVFADPVVTAWELLKWSFILDWFITVGDILKAFSPFATGKLEFGSWAVTNNHVTYCDFEITTFGDFIPMSGSPNAGYISSYLNTYSRVPLEPVPHLAFRVDLSWAKLADLLALWILGNRKINHRITRSF